MPECYRYVLACKHLNTPFKDVLDAPELYLQTAVVAEEMELFFKSLSGGVH